MRSLAFLMVGIWFLVSCADMTTTPIVTYRVNTGAQQQLAYIQIDANGFVVRTMAGATDEFQLNQTDFALVLDQLRAANITTMRLPEITQSSDTTTVFHTIVSGTNEVTFADQTAPASVKPLLVTFQRILTVNISTTP